MTQEEKELLIKDLCPRLKYRVKCAPVTNTGEINTIGGYCEVLDSVFIKEIDGWVSITMIKPYLRPMSSMTEEEKIEYRQKQTNYEFGYFDTYASIDWLNKKGFDYRGLIPMRLALPTTEEMYKN